MFESAVKEAVIQNKPLTIRSFGLFESAPKEAVILNSGFTLTRLRPQV